MKPVYREIAEEGRTNTGLKLGLKPVPLSCLCSKIVISLHGYVTKYVALNYLIHTIRVSKHTNIQNLTGFKVIMYLGTV